MNKTRLRTGCCAFAVLVIATILPVGQVVSQPTQQFPAPKSPSWAQPGATTTPPAQNQQPQPSKSHSGDDAKQTTFEQTAGEGEDVTITDIDELSLEKLLADKTAAIGARRKQKTSVSLSTTSVIEREDIDALPYFFLGDLLATLPGLDVRWGNMQRLYVGARGFGGTALSSRMLLLWDGLPLNDPVTGELTAGHFVPLVDIERIEVIRGPGSTLYGANAFSGVVNIITDSGKEEGVRASLSAGSDRTARAQAAYRGSVGPVRLMGNAEAFRSDGPFPTAEREMGETVEVFKNDDVESVALSASAAYKGFRLAGRYVHGERGRPGNFPTDGKGSIIRCDSCHNSRSHYGQGWKYQTTGTSCGSCHLQPHDRETVHRGSVYGGYDGKLHDNVRLSVNAYHNEWFTEYTTTTRTEMLRDSPLVTPEISQRTTGAQAHISINIGDINTTIVGGEGKRLEASSPLITPSDGGNHVEQHESAVFFEDELRPVDWLAITGGARVDFNSRFGTAFSPQGGAVITPFERFSIRGAVARAFRNPSFSELFIRDPRGKYIVEGNEDLKREWVTTIEGGLHYTFVQPTIIRLAGTVFYNFGRDIIYYRSTGIDTASFFNEGVTDGIGTEGEVEIQLTESPWLKWFLNYSFQRVTNGNGATLPYAPKHKVNSGIRFRHGRIGATARVRYVSGRMDNQGVALSGFVTVDAAAGYEVLEGLRLELWMHNIGNLTYQQSLGIPGAPRSFYVTVRYTTQ